MSRRFESFVFDFDSTIIKSESLEDIANEALSDNADKLTLLSKIKEITERGMEGKLSISESLQQRFQTIRANKSHIEAVKKGIINKISDSFIANKEFIAKNSSAIYIVSSGFKDIVDVVAEELGIPLDHVYANTFVYDDSGNILGVDETNFLAQQSGKANLIKTLPLAKQIVMIGDGFTDLETKLLGSVDAFVYYDEHVHREVIASQADLVAKNLDEVIEYIA